MGKEHGSQQVNVDRELAFRGPASHTGNVQGRFSHYNQIVYYDDFVGKAIDATNDYTFHAENSGTSTIAVPHNLVLTTGAADDDECELAMGVDYYPQYNCCMEARVRCTDVDKSAFNVGWSDSQNNDADEISIMLSSTTPTVDKDISDGALFVADADMTTYTLRMWSCKGGTDGATLDAVIIPTDTMWMTLRVEFEDNGTTSNAHFYANSTGLEIDPALDYVGTELDAATRTTALCPYVGLIGHNAAASGETLLVDYIKVWQDRY